MFQGDCGDPHIININTETTQMPLGISSTARGWMRPPNLLHDLSITISCCNPYFPNEVKHLIFYKPSASRASLGICGGSNAKAPF